MPPPWQVRRCAESRVGAHSGALVELGLLIAIIHSSYHVLSVLPSEHEISNVLVLSCGGNFLVILRCPH